MSHGVPITLYGAYLPRVRLLIFDFFSLPSPPFNPIDAGNTFTGPGTKIEFNGVKDTVWTGNSLPLGMCLDSGGSSTFGASDGLPADC